MNFKLDAFRAKMSDEGISSQRIEHFIKTLHTLASGETGLLPEETILPATDIPDYSELPEVKGPLEQVAMMKLNGGLGTSMGLERPKSMLTVKGEDTFLDIVVKQTLALSERIGSSLPLVLMNSFSTSEESLKHLKKYKELKQDLPFEFLQSMVPKIDMESGLPAEWAANPSLEWCPPGHGDIYQSLAESGVARLLLEAGIKYVFVSNIDNLGATIDEKILAYFAESEAPFLMEVTRRTPADKKGGHLAKSQDGRLVLREVAQCPENDLESFQDIERHQFFNTNNLWLNLDLIEKDLENISLPLIINRKTVDPADPQSTAVIQAETAMGAAITVFDGALALNVPRSRFAPVKNTSDLLLVRSNLFELDEAYRLSATQDHKPSLSLSSHYQFMKDFERLIGSDLDLSECESLSLEGEISLAPQSKIVGKVELVNTGHETLCLEGRIA